MRRRIPGGVALGALVLAVACGSAASGRSEPAAGGRSEPAAVGAAAPTNPRARDMPPTAYFDDRFVRELETSGFIKGLPGQ